jgi:hypothetical protein
MLDIFYLQTVRGFCRSQSGNCLAICRSLCAESRAIIRRTGKGSRVRCDQISSSRVLGGFSQELQQRRPSRAAPAKPGPAQNVADAPIQKRSTQPQNRCDSGSTMAATLPNPTNKRRSSQLVINGETEQHGAGFEVSQTVLSLPGPLSPWTRRTGAIHPCQPRSRCCSAPS